LKKKYLRSWPSKLALFLLCFGAAERICYRLTDGFWVSKVTSSLKPDPRWDVEPLEPAAELAVEKILSQPFHYFGSGGECYVFLSQDGKTIMKVFKHYRMRTNLFCKDWPLAGPLKTYVDSHQERFERIFTSCKIAYDDLREEAGLVYVHLNKTSHLKKKLTLTDKINVVHHVDLDNLEFVLQERGDLLFQKLTQLIQNGEEEKAKAMIDSLLNLIVARCKKGVCDGDPALKRNFACLSDRVIAIDIGPYTKDPYLQGAHSCKLELFCETLKLRDWTRKYHPALFEEVNAKIDTAIFSINE
jgi:hypothetical protein